MVSTYVVSYGIEYRIMGKLTVHGAQVSTLTQLVDHGQHSLLVVR
jgi:hypothetical protein